MINKSLALISGKGGSGKTTIGLSMAALLSSCSLKVLLVDCDLRKGVVHKKFNIKNVDLSQLIVKNDNVNDYVNKTSVENLDVITRGVVPVNPSELLNSKVFKHILEKLEPLYDKWEELSLKME